MGRLIIRAFTVAAMLMVLVGTGLRADASGRGPCSARRYEVRPRMGHEVLVRKVRHLIGCAVHRFGPIPGGVTKARRVASCESSYWPWAYSSGNAGIYQQRTAYWPGRVDRYLREAWFPRLQTGWRPSPYHARANVIVSIRMVHTAGWGPWEGGVCA